MKKLIATGGPILVASLAFTATSLAARPALIIPHTSEQIGTNSIAAHTSEQIGTNSIAAHTSEQIGTNSIAPHSSEHIGTHSASAHTGAAGQRNAVPSPGLSTDSQGVTLLVSPLLLGIGGELEK